MPIYEYKCDECENSFDEFQSADAERTASCPSCGSKARRVFSPRIAVIYSGWGYNSTDSLISGDKRGKDFSKLKEKAEQLYYEDPPQ